MANNPVFFSAVILGLVLATGLSPVDASDKDPFDFLSRFHPKVSTAMIVTGPEHVERVQNHSLVFSPLQTHHVLPELDKVLTKRNGWTKLVSTPGKYVVYEHGGTHLCYMSDQVYRHLNWPNGTKLLRTPKGSCVVEYFHLTYETHKHSRKHSGADAEREKY